MWLTLDPTSEARYEGVTGDGEILSAIAVGQVRVEPDRTPNED